MTTPAPTTAGFSLLEVMAALAVMALATMSLAGAMVSAKGTADRSKSYAAAQSRVEGLIEEIQGQPFSQAQAYHNSTFAIPGLSPLEGATTVGQITVTDHPSVTGMRVIRIVVAWDEVGGEANFETTYYHVNRGG